MNDTSTVITTFNRHGKRLLPAALLMALSATVTVAEPRSPEKVFDDTCRFCHGHYIAPGLPVIRDIRGQNLPATLIKTYVRNGPGAMPAFRQTEITDEELEALAKWVETSKAPPLPAAAGGPNGH